MRSEVRQHTVLMASYQEILFLISQSDPCCFRLTREQHGAMRNANLHPDAAGEDCRIHISKAGALVLAGDCFRQHESCRPTVPHSSDQVVRLMQLVVLVSELGMAGWQSSLARPSLCDSAAPTAPGQFKSLRTPILETLQKNKHAH